MLGAVCRSREKENWECKQIPISKVNESTAGLTG